MRQMAGAASADAAAPVSRTAGGVNGVPRIIGQCHTNLIRPAAKTHILSSSQPCRQRWMFVVP